MLATLSESASPTYATTSFDATYAADSREGNRTTDQPPAASPRLRLFPVLPSLLLSTFFLLAVTI
jgi:hypothetical protein